MPCTRPIGGYRGPGGRISTSPKGNYIDQHITLACGRCIDCKLEHSRQWAVRITHEAQLNDSNSFITLTYDQDHLPTDRSLDTRHWQLFAKRLRKSQGPFRFYHCGEYGDQRRRPHYHACLFGLDFASDRRRIEDSKSGMPQWSSPTLDSIWGQGRTTVSDLTFESAAYVARYCTKKITGDLAEDHYAQVDETTGEVTQLKPEYSTMSRRPGIGKLWYDKYSDQVYPRDEVIMRGKAARPPKYYDQLLEKENPELHHEIKIKRRTRDEEKYELENTRERQKVRETCTLAKTNLYSRNL